MKKIALLFLILVSTATLAHADSPDRYNLSCNPNNQSIQAYVLMRGQWIQGWVTYSEYNGTITSVSFPRTEYAYAQLLGPVRPTPLNPNNTLAIKYNFTHYVDITGYGRAFFVL
jgi:hypothetical protein